MKNFLIFLGLILPVLCQNGENMLDLNAIPVCATLNNVNKTFDNIWQLYNEFKTSGQLWIPVATGVCPEKEMDCTVLEPVCAVTKDNFFKTFPNVCILQAEQEATGTIWNIVFNGICSANPADGFDESSPPLNKVALQPSHSSALGLVPISSASTESPSAPIPGSIHYKPHPSSNNGQNLYLSPAVSVPSPSYAAAIASGYTSNQNSYPVQQPQPSSDSSLQPCDSHDQSVSDKSQDSILASYNSPSYDTSPKPTSPPLKELKSPGDSNNIYPKVYAAAPLAPSPQNHIPSSSASPSSTSYILVPTNFKYFNPHQIVQPNQESQVYSKYNKGSSIFLPSYGALPPHFSYQPYQKLQSAEESQTQATQPEKGTEDPQPIGYGNKKLDSLQTPSLSSYDGAHNSQCSELIIPESAQELQPADNYIEKIEPKPSPYQAVPSVPSGYYNSKQTPQLSSQLISAPALPYSSLPKVAAPSFSLQQYKPELLTSPSYESNPVNCSQTSENEAAPIPPYSSPSGPSSETYPKSYVSYYAPHTYSQSDSEPTPNESLSPLYSQSEVKDIQPSQPTEIPSPIEGCQQPASNSATEPSNEQSAGSSYYSQIPNAYSATSDASSNDDQQNNLENSNHLEPGNQPNEGNEGQIVYNGVVYQGPYYYEPKYKHINFGNFNILPAHNPSSPAETPEEPPLPQDIPKSQYHGYGSNPFEELLKHLLYIASLKNKSG